MDEIVVRTLRPTDMDRVVAIDAALTGRRRRAFYEGVLRRALAVSDVHVSLGADIDDHLVGAVFAVLQYGEFGQAEPVAVIETLLVDPARARQGVGAALMEQLTLNLQALRVERIRTEVSWNEQDLIGFFARQAFTPASRLVLERTL